VAKVAYKLETTNRVRKGGELVWRVSSHAIVFLLSEPLRDHFNGNLTEALNFTKFLKRYPELVDGTSLRIWIRDLNLHSLFLLVGLRKHLVLRLVQVNLKVS
jgi:hypothetical protein